MALALEAKPSLTWRDLQHLVVITSNPQPLMAESGWAKNSLGRLVSHKFDDWLLKDLHAEVAQQADPLLIDCNPQLRTFNCLQLKMMPIVGRQW